MNISQTLCLQSEVQAVKTVLEMLKASGDQDELMFWKKSRLNAIAKKQQVQAHFFDIVLFN